MADFEGASLEGESDGSEHVQTFNPYTAPEVHGRQIHDLRQTSHRTYLRALLWPRLRLTQPAPPPSSLAQVLCGVLWGHLCADLKRHSKAADYWSVLAIWWEVLTDRPLFSIVELDGMAPPPRPSGPQGRQAATSARGLPFRR